MYWKILRKCVFLFHICVCPAYLLLLAAGLPYVRFCPFFADGVGWVGMGWGGLITFNGTSTHTWCYATDLVSCTCTHTWCYATDLVSCTCTHTWCYATDLVSCTSTHTWCYATDLVSCTCTHTWCYATDLVSCTCTHTWCYATDLVSCTCTHTWCYATDLVSCTCTHTWCYATDLVSCTCTHTWCYATALVPCTCTHTWCYATDLVSSTCTHTWCYTNSACPNLSRLTAETLRANMQRKCCARKKQKARIFCCLPVAKSKSIKKQGILKQPLSTPGVHKSVQIQVKNDEKIKHNGISHILWPNMMMIASKVLQIPRDKHEGHHKDSWENAKTHAR